MPCSFYFIALDWIGLFAHYWHSLVRADAEQHPAQRCPLHALWIRSVFSASEMCVWDCVCCVMFWSEPMLNCFLCVSSLVFLASQVLGCFRADSRYCASRLVILLAPSHCVKTRSGPCHGLLQCCTLRDCSFLFFFHFASGP